MFLVDLVQLSDLGPVDHGLFLHFEVKYNHILLEQLYILFVLHAGILFIPSISVDTHFIIRTFHIVTSTHVVLYRLGDLKHSLLRDC